MAYRLEIPVLFIFLAALSGCGTGPTNDRSEAEAVFHELAEPVAAVGGNVTVRLDLSGTSVDDPTLATLPLLDLAEYVNLSNTAVTENGLAHLARVGVNIRHIDLTGMRLTAAGLESLKNMPRLQQVDFHHGEAPREALFELLRFLSDRAAARASTT